MTKNKLSIIFLITMLLGIAACSNKVQDEEDAAINEKVQDTFYGAKFGDNREKVIEQLKKNGLYLDNNTSTETILDFSPVNSKYFSFGTTNWELLRVSLTNNKFDYIEFYVSNKDSIASQTAFEGLQNTIMSKYNMSDMVIPDNSTFKLLKGKGKNNVFVAIYYDKYESIDESMYFGNHLVYYTHKYEQEANKEL